MSSMSSWERRSTGGVFGSMRGSDASDPSDSSGGSDRQDEYDVGGRELSV